MTTGRLCALVLGALLVIGGAVALSLGAASPPVVVASLAVTAAGLAAGAWATWHGTTTAAAVLIVLVTVSARVPLVMAPPVLEDDVYRYLWDGAVVASGHSPYEFSPQQVYDRRLGREVPDVTDAGARSRLDTLAELSATPSLDPAFSRINYPSVPTIYPPVTQAVFGLVATFAPGSVVALKIVLALADLVACGLLVLLLGAAGLPRRRALLYAWSPLALVSFAGAAHMDVIAVVLALAAVALALSRRGAAAGAALGLAAGAKLFPIVLWPALRRRLGVTGSVCAGVVFAAAYLPFASTGRLFEGLGTYATTWRFNGAGFLLLDAWLPDPGARLAAAVLVVTVAFGLARRDEPVAILRASAWTLAALVLLAPAVNPWYVAWILPFAAATASLPLLVLGVTALGYYGIFWAGGVTPWLRLVQFGMPLAAAAWVSARRLPRNEAAPKRTIRHGDQPT